MQVTYSRDWIQQTECMDNYEQWFIKIVQEAILKQSPRERNAKRQNGCLKRPYKIAEKRREADVKGEKER